ncbi:MAG TPA: hypothetical protein VFR18_25180 [Terriglobia bacterium]|nr:hypothetical protein [Terriglobia bacterium]
MRPNARWRGAANVCLLFVLSITQLEPVALAQNANKSEERTNPSIVYIAAAMQPQQRLPSRSSIKVSQAQLPPQPAPIRALLPPSAPAQDSKKRTGLKWILIAAAGAGVTAFVLANQNSSPDIPQPVITVGQVEVGQPQ